MILVGELLSFSFVVIDTGLSKFQWAQFGAVSFLVQWIILASAACLCPLRPWLRVQNGIVAGSVCYGIVLLLTAVFSYFGLWLMTKQLFSHHMAVAENLVISAVFAGVVLRYFYLQQQLHNREQAELKSRIQALQSRIRPHFLFNSMNSIASLIDFDPKSAEKMVVDLSQLFRASLSDETIVSVDQEIALCKQFISIEKMRLGDRLVAEWDVQLPNSGVEIPSLLMQPLIENAIYHGIQPLPDGGVVNIKISSENDLLVIKISNPYVAGKKEQGMHNGIALENIRHRLDAIYGKACEFYFSDRQSTFIVTIKYPIDNVTK